MGWVGEFGNQEWGSVCGESETKANHEASADEHPDVLRGCLKHGRTNHDDCTNEDSSTTTNAIRHVRGERVGCEGTDVLDGVEKTELALI